MQKNCLNSNPDQPTSQSKFPLLHDTMVTRSVLCNSRPDSCVVSAGDFGVFACKVYPRLRCTHLYFCCLSFENKSISGCWNEFFSVEGSKMEYMTPFLWLETYHHFGLLCWAYDKRHSFFFSFVKIDDSYWRGGTLRELAHSASVIRPWSECIKQERVWKGLLGICHSSIQSRYLHGNNQTQAVRIWKLII